MNTMGSNFFLVGTSGCFSYGVFVQGEPPRSSSKSFGGFGLHILLRLSRYSFRPIRLIPICLIPIRLMPIQLSHSN
jgi:hypothetical protein